MKEQMLQNAEKRFSEKNIAQLESIDESLKELLNAKGLPDELRNILSSIKIEEKYNEVLDSLSKQEREKETIAVDENKREVRIGRIRTPIFEGGDKKKIMWNVSGEQFRESGQTMVEIGLKRNDGIELNPGEKDEEGKTRFEDKDKFIPLAEFKFIKKEYPKYAKMAEKSTNLKDDYGKAKSGLETEKYFNELREKHPESEWVLRALRHLNGIAGKEAGEVLGRDPYFEETPHTVETLEKFTRLANRQLERKQGILILEGDAGTGKNKSVDHFAHLTRRELFRFTCSAGKDEGDIKYLLEYDPKKGTYRIKSSVVEALQTPGSILEFDEINTLKPEVAKMLNSLFDHDRAIFMGEDRKKVKAEEGVLLVGLQNPQHYSGVKATPETILSRARVMEVAYPPLIKKVEDPKTGREIDWYRADEAMMMRRHTKTFKDMNKDEFQVLWDGIVNKIQDPRIADLVSQDRLEKIGDLQEIVMTANKIRDAYKGYHEGKPGYDNPIKFIFSIRESIECAYELDEIELTEDEKKRGVTRAKKALKEVILPKIPLGEERIYLSSLIDQI